jgi:SNF2 family DNA or RNA helicase
VNKQIFVHHIIAAGTVDEFVLASLNKKNKGQQSLFDALKELGKKRRRF